MSGHVAREATDLLSRLQPGAHLCMHTCSASAMPTRVCVYFTMPSQHSCQASDAPGLLEAAQIASGLFDAARHCLLGHRQAFHLGQRRWGLGKGRQGALKGNGLACLHGALAAHEQGR
eukprot:1157551-Pelagomonas_calceolata.AAC.5